MKILGKYDSKENTEKLISWREKQIVDILIELKAKAEDFYKVGSYLRDITDAVYSIGRHDQQQEGKANESIGPSKQAKRTSK